MKRWLVSDELGVTLLELILALVIAVTIVLLSFKQYQAFRADEDVQEIQYNLDTLFQGLAGYYKANCYGQSLNGELISQGNLYVSSTNQPKNPYPINIATDLINNGYLANTLLNVDLVNNASAIGTNGYVVQFNEYTETRNICTKNAASRGNHPAFGSNTGQNCKINAEIGTVITWKAQVAVDLADPTTAKQYLAILNGDCLSSATGNTVIPCSTSGNTGTYVVFERLPSFARQTSTTDATEMNVMVNQFTQQYATYPAGYLINSVGVGPNGEQQYFYCGS